MDKKTKSTIVSFVFWPLFVTALWEKILSPLFDDGLELVLSVSNRLFTNISDRIYTDISNGLVDKFPSILCSCFFGVLCAITIYFLFESHEMYKSYWLSFQNKHSKKIQNNKLNSDSDDSQDLANPQSLELYELSKRKFLFCSFFLIAIIVHLACFYSLSRQSYVQDTALRLTNNIEIVAPYISDLKYKQLKSEYHLMQSRSDYDNLVSELESIGLENNLPLK